MLWSEFLLGWVPDDKGRRPAYVIGLSTDQKRVLVFVGTGTARLDWPHVLIEPIRREGMVLKLSKPTYFYARNTRLVSVGDFDRAAQCGAALRARFATLTESIPDSIYELLGVKRGTIEG